MLINSIHSSLIPLSCVNPRHSYRPSAPLEIHANVCIADQTWKQSYLTLDISHLYMDVIIAKHSGSVNVPGLATGATSTLLPLNPSHD